MAVQDHRPQLVEHLGVEQESIQILSYCGVKVANESAKTVSLTKTRILALTDEAMFLYTENIRKAPNEPHVRIPLEDIREVSLRKSEVLIRHEGQLRIIALYNKNIYDEDRAGTQDLFNQLLARGVAEYTAVEESYTVVTNRPKNWNKPTRTKRIPAKYRQRQSFQ
ncbi:MAG: hypothetical protein O3C43_23935 [Verrucomicrobia bacterium]|nr:hypothetical protein [Verrucomicrobiota bacterium]